MSWSRKGGKRHGIPRFTGRKGLVVGIANEHSLAGSRAIAKNAAKRRVTFDCMVTNQAAQTVIGGTAEVIAPTEKICRERIEPPSVDVHATSGRA
jgi:hypothetical protein